MFVLNEVKYITHNEKYMIILKQLYFKRFLICFPCKKIAEIKLFSHIIINKLYAMLFVSHTICMPYLCHMNK